MVLTEQDTKTSEKRLKKAADNLSGKGFQSDERCMAVKNITQFTVGDGSGGGIDAGETKEYTDINEAPDLGDIESRTDLECVRSKVSTPGSMLGDSITRGLGDQSFGDLLSGGQLADYVAAIADAAISKATQIGFSKLVEEVSGGKSTSSGNLSTTSLVGNIDNGLNIRREGIDTLASSYDTILDTVNSNIDILENLKVCSFSLCYETKNKTCDPVTLCNPVPSITSSTTSSDVSQSVLLVIPPAKLPAICKKSPPPVNICIAYATDVCEQDNEYKYADRELESAIEDLERYKSEKSKLSSDIERLEDFSLEIKRLKNSGSPASLESIQSLNDEIEKLPSGSDYIQKGKSLTKDKKSLDKLGQDYEKARSQCDDFE
jgi:hypothetical protein